MALTENIDQFLGTLAYAGDRPALETELSIITYDTASAQMKDLSNIDELSQHQDDSKISWINVSGLKDVDSIKKLGITHGIHPLSIEDIVHTKQQPKVEIFKDYRFLSLKTIQQEKHFNHHQYRKKKSIKFFRKNKGKADEIDEFIIDQVSFIIKKNVLITFQGIPGDPFDGVRKRILNGIGDIRKMGTDYLTYEIIDAVVDEYFLTLNHLEYDIENFEDRATKTNDDNFTDEIQDTKRYLLQIKRAILPLKDNMQMINHLNFFQAEDLKPFLQDLNEHLNNAIVTVEHYREWLSNIMDVNLSVLSQQTNKVMKVLTMISTIFIPLTFIAGVYGMNFEFMPELGYTLAYPIVLGGMGFIALIMIVIFKIYRWF
jgi:magnesium transporter